MLLVCFFTPSGKLLFKSSENSARTRWARLAVKEGKYKVTAAYLPLILIAIFCFYFYFTFCGEIFAKMEWREKKNFFSSSFFHFYYIIFYPFSNPLQWIIRIQLIFQNCKNITVTPLPKQGRKRDRRKIFFSSYQKVHKCTFWRKCTLLLKGFAISANLKTKLLVFRSFLLQNSWILSMQRVLKL
jgi:hypothetical protein